MARKKIIWIVERFYECVRLTLMTWWIFIKNFLVYGLIDTSCLLTSYMLQPEDKRDSIKVYLESTKVNLKYRKIVSFIISVMFITWLCTYILLLRNKKISSVISFIFWILSIWLVLLGVYVSILGLTWSTNTYKNAIEYYAQAFANFFREPLISLTCLTFWLLIYLISVRNPILLIFVLPGLLIMVKTGMYKKLQERKDEKNKKQFEQ